MLFSFNSFRQICCAAIAIAIFAPLHTASAFWFLPILGAKDTSEIRAQVFKNTITEPDLNNIPDAPSVSTQELSEPQISLENNQPSSVEDTPTMVAAATQPIEDPISAPQTIRALKGREVIELPPEQATQLTELDFALAELDLISSDKLLNSQNPEIDSLRAAQRFSPTFDVLDAAVQPALSTFPIITFLEVEAGDTLSSLFQSVGISISEIHNAGRALSDVFNLAGLRPGQILEIEINGAVEPFEAGRLQRVSLSPTTLEQIEVIATPEGFLSQKSEISLTRILVFAGGPLNNGAVYVDGDELGIDGSMIANFVNALDAQVNFSRIQSVGDEIEMVYEAYFDDNGRLVDAGDVLYAAYTDQDGDTYEAFRFENENKAAYFTRDARFTGQTNTLMRKPLGGGRLSSRYGMRTHPVYGDRRMHNGVDYAASCGTPVYAAGEGTITAANWNGGYGRFVAIKHGPTFTTNYAHLKSFANGMRPGVRVRKGQLIGRVGTTGASTGCHLHYEVVRNGRKINPLSDHIPRGDDLNAAAKERFLLFVNDIDGERDQGLTMSEAFSLARSGNF